MHRLVSRLAGIYTFLLQRGNDDRTRSAIRMVKAHLTVADTHRSYLPVAYATFETLTWPTRDAFCNRA